MQKNNIILILCLLSFLLVLIVVPLGAYVRLSDAGLGCPDWPGCYGQLLIPDTEAEIAQANIAYPERPFEERKAWLEMVHRYAASLLGFIILVMAVIAWRTKRSVISSTLLLAVVIFQGMLGMWTVTMLLKPAIVTAHLLGGMATMALIFWLLLSQTNLRPTNAAAVKGLKGFTIGALIILMAQITLGGWTSTNYAALICPEFPTCRDGAYFPEMDFDQGFTIWHGLGVDYEGGILDAAARTAIHVSHRIGAIIATLVIGGLAIIAMLRSDKMLKIIGATVLTSLILQVSIGIGNIVYVLPMSLAVAHNAVAAILLLTVLTLFFYIRREPAEQ